MVKAKEEVVKVEQDLVETVRGDRDDTERQRTMEDQRERLLGKHETMLRNKVCRFSYQFGVEC